MDLDQTEVKFGLAVEFMRFSVIFLLRA